MKNSSFLLIFVASLFFTSCSKEKEVAPDDTEKMVRIEIDISGSYQYYSFDFHAPSFYSEANLQVNPIIKSPANLNWNLLDDQRPNAPDNRGLKVPITYNKLIIESETPVYAMVLTFDAIVDLDYDPFSFEGFEPLKATIKVFANDKLEATFNFEGSSIAEIIYIDKDWLIKS